MTRFEHRLNDRRKLLKKKINANAITYTALVTTQLPKIAALIIDDIDKFWFVGQQTNTHGQRTILPLKKPKKTRSFLRFFTQSRSTQTVITISNTPTIGMK